MAKAILRTAKLKTLGNIASSLSHNYRTRKTPNADPNRSHENLHDMHTTREVSEGIKSRIPAKHRSDAVLCIEYFIGASPEYFKTGDDPRARNILPWLENGSLKDMGQKMLLAPLCTWTKHPHT